MIYFGKSSIGTSSALTADSFLGYSCAKEVDETSSSNLGDEAVLVDKHAIWRLVDIQPLFCVLRDYRLIIATYTQAYSGSNQVRL